MGAHVVLMGPSGSGKTSLMRGLAHTEGERQYVIDQPWITRARRQNEGSEEYKFVDEATFMRNRGNFLFMGRPYDQYWFALQAPPPLLASEMRMRALLPENAEKFREMVNDNVLLCAVRPQNIAGLADRIRSRDPQLPEAQVVRRLSAAAQELDEAAELADIQFENVDGLDLAVSGLHQILERYCAQKGW